MNSKNWVRWDSRCLKMQNYPCNINHGGTETINGCPFSPYRIVLFRLGRDPSTLYLILFRSRSWMHFLAKLFSFIYIEPILSYVFSVHQIIINLEAEHSMQPINFFLGLRAIWMTPHCFDCACQHLFGAPLHYHSVSVLIPHDQSTCSEVSFLIILPFFFDGASQ